MMRKLSVFAAVLLAVLVGALLARGCYPKEETPNPFDLPTTVDVPALPVAPVTSDAPPTVDSLPIAPPPAPQPIAEIMPPEIPEPTPKPRRSRKKKVAAKPEAGPSRPKVELHPELIPKSIRIVRVYYGSMIAGPGDTIEFDVNGSGFTAEFHKQLTVQPGMANVQVRDFSLVTPNQIHGRLIVSPSASTSFAFPTVSVGGKPVFQAAEPFAVIRPGEVLNFVFTEMGESGRSGRFRIFTNIDADMFSGFRVEPSTPSISLGGLSPRYPFIVDGVINVGPAVTGEYGVKISLGDKVLWKKDGIIRIVNPNVGQTGLVLRIQAEDGFHRPGDVVRFLVQGSGFQGQDAGALSADIVGVEGETSAFTFLAPGRMSLDLKLPKAIKGGSYKVVVLNGNKSLLETADAFRVVPLNWIRSVETTPPLRPGSSGQIVLQGRSLQNSFVQSLRVVVDEPGLKISAFKRVSAIQASADITVLSSVRPGDYQVRIRSGKRRVVPHAGDIIRILPAE